MTETSTTPSPTVARIIVVACVAALMTIYGAVTIVASKAAVGSFANNGVFPGIFNVSIGVSMLCVAFYGILGVAGFPYVAHIAFNKIRAQSETAEA